MATITKYYPAAKFARSGIPAPRVQGCTKDLDQPRTLFRQVRLFSDVGLDVVRFDMHIVEELHEFEVA